MHHSEQMCETVYNVVHLALEL